MVVYLPIETFLPNWIPSEDSASIWHFLSIIIPPEVCILYGDLITVLKPILYFPILRNFQQPENKEIPLLIIKPITLADGMFGSIWKSSFLI